jgi:DNA-binding transcriptional LysR family regulator
MRITLDALLVLDTIQRYGSFAAAADALHRVRSALTYSIQTLERDLDIKIFDRSGHRAQLTPVGKLLLKEGRTLLSSAHQLEAKIKQYKTGWEEKISIVIDEAISLEKILPWIEKFYQACPWTTVSLQTEILNGCWDALLSQRADLAIGVSGDSPSANDYGAFPFMSVNFVFAVAPNHPLASLPEPLKNTDIIPHRAIVVADTSTYLPQRSAGLFENQPTLTVSSMQAKIDAQKAGLGVGYLPAHLIQKEIEQGELIIKATEKTKPTTNFSIAWRLNPSPGKALQWWLTQLKSHKEVKN